MKQVSRLITHINHTLKEMELDSNKLNFSIDKDILSERLKSDHMKDVIRELEYLSSQKTQFIDHQFKKVKEGWNVISETEIQSKNEYEDGRTSKFMINLISKLRGKINQEMSKNIKLLKAAKTS